MNIESQVNPPTTTCLARLATNELTTVTVQSDNQQQLAVESEKRRRHAYTGLQLLCKVGRGFFHPFRTFYVGGRIVCTKRHFIWLIPSYSLALYAHRFLEGGIAPVVARRYFGDASLSLIVVTGSSVGELIGALFIFLYSPSYMSTPVPWLRVDALFMLIVWYLPFWKYTLNDIPAQMQSLIMAATLLPIGMGWAAADVSMSAYIQANLDGSRGRRAGHRAVADCNEAALNGPTVSASDHGAANKPSDLNSVMSFLNTLQIILYAIGSNLLGTYMDRVYNEQTAGNAGAQFPIREGLWYVAGVQYSAIAVVILVSTFIPKRAA